MPMVNQFSQVPINDYQRNAFVRNHTWKGTFDSGYLIPVFFDEVLPGDTKQLNTTFFGRLSTPFVPFLDNVYLDYHLFYVPNRLLWDNWQRFMGERKNPKDSIDFLVPTINSGENGFQVGGYLDYLGVSPGVPNLTLSSVIFYLNAINLIWNEWYRDENLQDSIEIDTSDKPKTEDMYPLLKRGKRQDYFTSALPTPQKGPGVELPIGGIAPVVGNGMALGLSSTVNQNYQELQVGANLYGSEIGTTYNSSILGVNYGLMINNSAAGITQDPDKSGMVADLTQATAATINSLRQAIALQQFLELDMRGGTRYVELILQHFGVQCPDYRLQRPEYLGGGTTMLNVNPVVQTSSTNTTSPQGNLAGYATFATSGSGFTKSFVEHGVVIGLVSVRCDLTYQQGVDRHFLRNTRYDYYWNTLAHLGDQGIYNMEIYAQGNDQDKEIFGYQERYGEYRYKNSYITGKFRSLNPASKFTQADYQSLDIWHLAQKFENLPTLSPEFIEENPPIKRVLAVQNEPEILLDVYHDYTDIREVPMYGIPGLGRI